MSHIERRRFRRVPLPTRIQAQSGADSYEVTAENISVGGMLVRASATLAEGQTVQLSFKLPGMKEEIRIEGVVQHVSPNAFMGISFRNLSPAVEAAIQKFVESKEPVP